MRTNQPDFGLTILADLRDPGFGVFRVGKLGVVIRKSSMG
jgi:hypothetical protein